MLLFGGFIFAAWMTLSSKARLADREVYTVASRYCTVDELLPHPTLKNSSISEEWSDESTVKPVYGCDCSFTRARYFCESLRGQGYRSWTPLAVSEGICKSVTPYQISKAPLPPGFKVLMYGNSHLRQVLEALMCMVSDKVSRKRVFYKVGSEKVTKTVSGVAACRHSTSADWATLSDHHCLLEADQSQGKGKDCSDDTAEFYMANDAVVDYYFSGGDTNKSIGDALSYHNNASWSEYDAVLANSGNSPVMSTESVLASAFELRDASVPFFWLSSYDGVGDVNDWETSDTSLFHESGARFVDISTMTRGLRSLTKGAIEEHSTSDSFSNRFGDPHFCLPGPPDEMALLLLKIMWALHLEGVE